MAGNTFTPEICEVRITSGNISQFLGEAAKHGIQLVNFTPIDPLTAQGMIFRKDLKDLNSLCQKRGENLEVLHQRGFWKFCRSIFRRPVLMGVWLWLLTLTLFLPTRVLFVRTEGNVSVPDDQILEAAEESGIHFGASRREVRSEAVKNALLEAIPQLQWVGVNTKGFVATVSVRERTDEDANVCEELPSSIIACRDGVILSCTATEGNLLCSPGQAVQKGDVLISGYWDTGLSIRCTRAEGEIYAQTVQPLRAVMPGKMMKKGNVTDRFKNISLIIGKKRINLWKDSGIWDGVCGRMYEEYYVTLPGGFCLPIAMAVETVTRHSCSPSSVSQDEAQSVLEDFCAGYLISHTIAGTILEQRMQMTQKDQLYTLEGEYICTEMIGRVQMEQIGEIYEQSD